ncbi:MAG: hypothetical protein HY816_06125 [Candidatus Wallbacteria bacterium]|nr:hypothetical protein [Candidatus Wallbacteria bacterium]
MSEELQPGASGEAPFASTDTDPGSLGLLKFLSLVVLLTTVLLPVGADLARHAKLQVAYSAKLDRTIAPHPDRFSGVFIHTADVEGQVESASREAAGNEAGEAAQPMSFWARVQFVLKSTSEWLKEPASRESNAQNLVMFWSLVVFMLFIIAARIYGVNRVMAVLSGMLGADRLKKIIIDMFILKGVERQVFPATKTTAVKNGVIGTHSLNRVDLHDVIRINVGLQGEGAIEVVREAVTVEGRTAYTYCPSITGSGGDFYFNLAKITTRSIKITADVLMTSSSKKGHVSRLKFDITGFKAAAWD